MNDNATGKPSLGDEIPYRRDRIEKKTGSLVFDQHLHEAAADTQVPGEDKQADVSKAAH